ncbi:MAG TPA: cyclic nucleotide-binding domain-containing protein [Anaeromyxobacter sp.]|nr:cyclic nucleotide-binding domain-containing protein [Anaeromyxobacter sp.]
MADLRALKDKAADLVARGKLDRAAETLRAVLKADPRDAATRQRLAEVLRRAGRTDEAVGEYEAVADRYARDGLFAKAIALCKTILEIDPEHGATQATLAGLYAARARSAPPTRLTAMALPAVLVPSTLQPAPSDPAEGNVELPLPAPRGAIAPPPPPEEGTAARPLSAAHTPLSQILSAAQAATEAGIEEEVILDLDEPVEPSAPPPAPGAGEEDLAGVPDDAILEAGPESPAAAEPPRGVPVPGDMALPRIPLLSDLSREAFIALTDGMVLRRVRAGETVLQEGERGTSFFVVAGGELEVTKRDDRGERIRLARLREGDFFGEMAILSGAPRLATVAALQDAEVLEIRAQDLLELAGRHPHLAQSLRRFYRQRLLANAMAVSPVFRPFSRQDRQKVMVQFRAREVAAGEVVVREGEPSDGLYVVLEGALGVSRRQGTASVEVAELREADVFGEMSCLRKTPATATVTARRAGTLLRLPRQGFDELILSHPQILEVVAQLTEERAENLDAILSGHAQWTEEGLVLV